MLSSVTNDAAYTEAPFNEGKWNKDAVKMILSLRKDQELAVAAEKDVKVNEFLAEWSKLVDLGLRGTELDEEVAKLVKDLDDGLVNLSGKASTISKDLLNTALGNGKPDVYEVVYKLVKADGTTEVTQSLRLSADAASKYLEAIGKKYNTTSGSLGEFVDGIKKIPLYVRKVVLDPNNIVTAASKATLLNTLPVNMLPSALRDEVKKFANTAEKVIRPATKAEMQDSKEFSSVGKEDDTAKFLLHDDPARGLVYNVSGKLSPQVVAAMYLAVGEALVTDKMKLMLGPKDDAVTAKMFGVHKSAVTKKMRDHAREHGMLRKTLANALGKDILKQLGYVNKKDDATGIGHYEALVASIGNMAVTVAEKHGLLETKKVGSSVLAEMYPEHDKEGKDQFSDKATTAFVHLRSIPETKGKYTRHKVKASVEKFTDTYKSNAEKLPGAKTRSTGPVFTPLTSDEIERQLTSVRNDITGVHKIPEVAKESLRHMMNTEYVFNHARGKELVDAYDDDVIGPQLKASLGYIEIDSEEYNNLPYRDKEIQPAINMGVEKAFEHIRGLVEKGSDVSMWFNHYFSSNGRFFIDSNGINPQTDKLMRFLTQPKSHKVTHKVDKSKGSPRFSKDGIDTSYYVRVGLAQAFGMGIDKEDPISTIRLGNVLLSLNKDQLKDLRNKFLTSKESVVISASVGKSTVEYKVEPEHLSHALQGIKFLEDVLDGDTVTSSLTAEFDALTSGFANKTQQFPVLVDADGNSTMDDHMLRVGILIPSKLAAYEEEMHIDYNGSKVFIGSISTVIKHGADKTPVFYDSYQNMAVTVGDTSKAAFDSIKRNERGSIADSQVQAKDQIVKLASEMESMLPRPDVNGKVTKALRTLFKSPFMVFNYSAGIKTIRENLSHDVVQDIMHKIAKNDDVGKQIAENLIKGGLSLDDKKATTVEQLVEFVRTEPITSNKLKMKGTKATGYSMMVKIVDATFGKAVEETFKSNFGKFIEIQDTVNDAFKVSFTRFEYAFNDKYKAKMDANGYVTEKEVQGIIEDLWDMFPWIKGPLTEGSNDVIPVVDVDTRNPGVMSGRAAPQTAIVVDGKNTSEKVHPIIRRLKAATSAGSVLPFHYIDGAQLARTVNELSKLGTMDEVGVLPVHDAITMPIHMMDTAANIFNKEWFHTGMEYSLIDSIVDMVNKWDSQVTLNQNTAKVKGLKAFQKGGYAYDESKKDGQNNTLTNAQAVIKEKLLKLQEEINKGREDYYAKAADPSSGYVYNNVVGTVGGAYKVGEDSPNQEYLKVFDGEYKTVKAELGKTAEEFEAAVAKAKSVDAVNNGPLGNPTIAKLIKGMYPNDKKNAVELFIEGCK